MMRSSLVIIEYVYVTPPDIYLLFLCLTPLSVHIIMHSCSKMILYMYINICLLSKCLFDFFETMPQLCQLSCLLCILWEYGPCVQAVAKLLAILLEESGVLTDCNRIPMITRSGLVV